MWEASLSLLSLTGIKQVNERIDVILNLVGADEFSLDAAEIAKIVRSSLASANVSLVKGDYKTPAVKVLISGKSSGGGAHYTVELVVTALLPSPFAKERSISAIVWRDTATAEHLIRFDPAAKELVKPTGPIRERVYDTVREVALRLASGLRGS